MTPREEMFRLIEATWPKRYAFTPSEKVACGVGELFDHEAGKRFQVTAPTDSIDTLLAGLPVPREVETTKYGPEYRGWYGRNNQRNLLNLTDPFPTRPEAHAAASLAAVRHAVQQWKEAHP